MGDKGVDREGNVHEKGWDGQYRQKQGIFGPVRDKDWLGNPKVERDWLGNSKQKRNWYGGQEKSSSGEPLFQGGSSGDGGSGILGLVALVLLIEWVAVFWIIRKWWRLCVRWPKVMIPLTVCLPVIIGFVVAIANH